MCAPLHCLQVYVEQPSVAQTVSILRGLRERYELHHGVRITDSALVEAAMLSDRYIADRCACLDCHHMFTVSSLLVGSCLPGRRPSTRARAC